MLKLIYRSPGSTNLVDAGNETFPALASALTDPALADEPYFLVEDHSNNDLILLAEGLEHLLVDHWG